MNKPLSPEELDIIRRLQAGENPDGSYDPYEPTVEWFTGKGKEEVMPLSAAPEPKRRWLPSKWEKQKVFGLSFIWNSQFITKQVMKIVRAIRQGRIVGSKPKTAGDKPQFYGIWNEPLSNQAPPLPAPKPALPTHAESYNPPEEYLLTDPERKEWENTDPENRERDYLPKKYPSLRLVPAYDQFIKQRFNRQLDLYLAPRIQRTRLNIDPNSLIPKLPSPSSLRPFPNYRSLRFTHMNARVRCVSTSPDGAWVVSGDDSGNVNLWEVNVGREVRKWHFDGKIGAVEWCPQTDTSYFVVGTYVVIPSQSRLNGERLIYREDKLHFIVPPNLPSVVHNPAYSTLAPATLPPATQSPVKWTSSPGQEDGVVLTVLLPAPSGLTKQITWHRKGDYLATVCTCNSS